MAFLLTADDFGVSHSVNESIVKAHRFGTIQAASLMMGEEGTEEAVGFAKANPDLRVGLHLTLVDGKSVLPYSDLPDLIDFNRNFPRDPAYTWLKYLFQPKLMPQLHREIRAQFEAFRLTNLPLSHVDGHHHQHLHPYVFNLVVELARRQGARWIRIPRENLGVWRKCAPHPTILKAFHGLIYHALTLQKRSRLSQQGFFVFDHVAGLLETFSLSKEYLMKLLDVNPPGNHEIFFHPGADWNHDLELLMDPEIHNELSDKKMPLELISKPHRY